MKIIKLHHPIKDRTFQGPVVLAMGFFDGLHLGHQKVIAKAKQIAKEKNLPLVVLTYNHHPSIVYRKISPHDNRYLTLNSYKMKLLESYGVDWVYQIDYTYAFQDQSPKEFVNNYLYQFKADTVVAGFDHTYGPKDIANMELLPKYVGDKINVVTIPSYDLENKKVSSTRIKRNLDQGDIETVDKLLNRPFRTHGTVMRGYARGRKLGFPTANIEHSEYQWLPAIGVYIVNVILNGNVYHGMASVGRNVTFGNNQPITVEINLLDFNSNIYGETVDVDWLYRTRGEIKFDGVDKLIDQLKKDKVETENYFIGK